MDHIAFSNVPIEPTITRSSSHNTAISSIISKFDIWNHLKKISEKGVKRAKCEYCIKIYSFHKGSGSSQLKKQHEITYSFNQPQ